MTFVLLAISPGGEAYWFRDQAGEVYRDDRFSPGDPLLVSESSVDAAVHEQAAERRDEPFEALSDMIRRVESLVPRVSIPAADLVSLSLARKAPRLLRGWLSDERAASIPAVVARLLASPEVSSESDLVRELATVQQQALRPTQPERTARDDAPRRQTMLDYLAA